jgi:hypothetical protein
MNRLRLCVLLPLLALAACDDPATKRQALAQCKIDPNAKPSSGFPEWDPLFLETCMRARGYAFDRNCAAWVPAQYDASCYWLDNWFTERFAHAKQAAPR